MIITNVLITHGPVQWRGQLVMHHDVKMMHHKLTAPLSWTACNQWTKERDNDFMKRLHNIWYLYRPLPLTVLPSVRNYPCIVEALA